MGFLMDGLEAEGYDRSYSDRQLVSRIFSYFRPHVGAMSFVALMIVLDSLLSAVLPILIARGIDGLTTDPAGTTAGWLIAAILVSGAAAWTANFFRQWYTARTVGDVVLELRQDAFDAVMARDMSFYDEYPTGKIVSRVTSDTQDFANVVTLTLNLISQVLLVAIIAAIALTHRRRRETRYQDPGKQVKVRAKDRLRVLQPNDPDNYYLTRELVRATVGQAALLGATHRGPHRIHNHDVIHVRILVFLGVGGSVPQGSVLHEHVLHARLALRLAAQRHERLALDGAESLVGGTSRIA